jgi:tetratricopeptide (TPR) repeat protein
VAPVADLRSAELAFLATGDEHHLDRAEALLSGDLRQASFTPATRLWLALLRYDRTGDDRHLNAAADACRTGDPALTEVAVAVLLRRWARDGGPADLDDAIGLAPSAGAGPPARVTGRDLPLWLEPAWRAVDLGYAYLERSRLHGTDDDLLAARGILRGAVGAAREPLIRALGLRQLAGCEQELYERHGRRRLLDQAIRRYERALTMVAEHSMVRPMLLTELGTALQDRFAADEDPGDIDRAVALAEEAVAAAVSTGSSRPDLACHLVNLGTALNTRYEQTGDPRDLDEAVRRWTEALDALPPASTYRPVFLDRVALGHLMRWQYGDGAEADLDTAIGYSRAAVREGAADPDVAVYANHLADALEDRWELHRDPADLHEAVRVFGAMMDSQPTDGAQAADLICNFAHTLLARYQAMGDRDDLDGALAVLGRIQAEALARRQRATVAALAARVLSMRYEAAGDPDDLAAAITAARRGLVGVDVMSTPRNSRTARLGHLLYLRYARHGRRRDLDEAISLLGDVTLTDEHREPSPDQLSQLAGYLAERYDRDGELADREAAITLSRQARESDRRDEEPGVDTALAGVLHDRFAAEGSLDDLDEAVARCREALARQLPGAPTYPAILNNLAIALQDCYVYRDDGSLLDEAIALHERAVAACPPGSPDRAGYLGTLAAAVQLRFERDRREADLDRVISLGQQALASLAPGAPEHSKLLASLAVAQHLHARHTREPADFDSAIITFRAALRWTRRGSPARPVVLAGYARALGDRAAGRSPAQVLRVFREALAASEHAPLVRLDVAASLGEWALSNRLWPQAADAYHAAAEARRTLFGAQLDRTYRDTWLARGDDITAAEASAWARSGQPRRAAAALDAGRALALSEALDARTVAGRLRARSHHELAARYEQAMRALARIATTRSEPSFYRE